MKDKDGIKKGKLFKSLPSTFGNLDRKMSKCQYDSDYHTAYRVIQLSHINDREKPYIIPNHICETVSFKLFKNLYVPLLSKQLEKLF